VATSKPKALERYPSGFQTILKQALGGALTIRHGERLTAKRTRNALYTYRRQLKIENHPLTTEAAFLKFVLHGASLIVYDTRGPTFFDSSEEKPWTHIKD
jgi:hypothetical protein